MKKYLIIVLSVLSVLSCIEDKSQYDYKDTVKVTFDSYLDHDFNWTAGDEVQLQAPITFSKSFESDEEIDDMFAIYWYANAELIAEGYKSTYVVDKKGAFSLVLKVVNRETGETYVSDIYRSNAKSAYGWGWIVLSERENQSSSLSFISPLALFVDHNLETQIPDGLGTGPRNIYHYYVLGSIPDVYISGVSKIVVNQQSGTVTLDGDSFQKDKWMKDEFASGTEPEEDFNMIGFAWKENYYLIYTQSGNIYVRYMETDYTGIPYYNTYSSTPYSFDQNSRITYFNSFKNVSYNVPNEDVVMLYDEQNSRFLAFVSGNSTGEPALIHLNFYDQTAEFDPSVPRVDNLGAGTKCLAIGAHEVSATTASNGYHIYPKYVALLDVGGCGNYQLYQFTVDPMSANNHKITENTMIPFSGGEVLTDNSIIQMSTDFEKNKYFYFTDGDKKIYVYSMKAGRHVLMYEADSKILSLTPSPLACPFGGFGANSASANFRLAVAQEGGVVSILDVQESKMVRFFENQSPNILLKNITGFGNIKDVEWVTNYEGEF